MWPDVTKTRQQLRAEAREVGGWLRGCTLGGGWATFSPRRVATSDRRSTSGPRQNVWQESYLRRESCHCHPLGIQPDVTHSLHGGASLVSAGEARACKHGTLVLFLRRRT